MEEKAIKVLQFLKAHTQITDVLGAGNACKIYPFWVNKGTAPPFITYNPGSAPFTKDARENGVVLYVWFSPAQKTEFMAFTDVVVSVLEQKYDVGNVETDFSQDEDSYILYAQIPIS